MFERTFKDAKNSAEQELKYIKDDIKMGFQLCHDNIKELKAVYELRDRKDDVKKCEDLEKQLTNLENSFNNPGIVPDALTAIRIGLGKIQKDLIDRRQKLYSDAKTNYAIKRKEIENSLLGCELRLLPVKPESIDSAVFSMSEIYVYLSPDQREIKYTYKDMEGNIKEYTITKGEGAGKLTEKDYEVLENLLAKKHLHHTPLQINSGSEEEQKAIQAFFYDVSKRGHIRTLNAKLKEVIQGIHDETGGYTAAGDEKGIFYKAVKKVIKDEKTTPAQKAMLETFIPLSELESTSMKKIENLKRNKDNPTPEEFQTKIKIINNFIPWEDLNISVRQNMENQRLSAELEENIKILEVCIAKLKLIQTDQLKTPIQMLENSLLAIETHLRNNLTKFMQKDISLEEKLKIKTNIKLIENKLKDSERGLGNILASKDNKGNYLVVDVAVRNQIKKTNTIFINKRKYESGVAGALRKRFDAAGYAALKKEVAVIINPRPPNGKIGKDKKITSVPVKKAEVTKKRWFVRVWESLFAKKQDTSVPLGVMKVSQRNVSHSSSTTMFKKLLISEALANPSKEKHIKSVDRDYDPLAALELTQRLKRKLDQLDSIELDWSAPTRNPQEAKRGLDNDLKQFMAIKPKMESNSPELFKKANEDGLEIRLKMKISILEEQIKESSLAKDKESAVEMTPRKKY